MIGTADRPCSIRMARARVMSAADCTKLSATMSTPSASPNARSRASLSVMSARSGTCGALMPLCSPSSPPSITRRLNRVRRRRLHHQLDLPIVEQQVIALRHRASPAPRRWSRCGPRTPISSPTATIRASPACSDQRRAALEPAGADLRAAQVLQDGDVLVGAHRGLAHLVKARGVIGLRAVRKIEADDVDAGGDERVEHRGIAATRARAWR